MKITITADFRAAAAQLEGIRRRQVPFAIASTLNELASEARRQMIDVAAPRDLQIRNKRFLGVAIRRTFATKARFVATIEDVLGREYLKTQAEGGWVAPAAGRKAFAIPTDSVKAKRRASGVPKALKPKNLQDTFRVTENGTTYIARSVGRGRAKRVEFLYILSKRARIPRRWKAYEAVDETVKRRADAIWIEQMRKALATAR